MPPLRPLVLIVDDEPDHAEIVALMLERRGFVTAVAPDGEQGLEMARRLGPSLILLDVYMPEVDGFATARHLSVDKRTQGIPILMVSAGGEAVGDRMMEWQPSSYLSKPFHAAELYRAVEAALAADGRAHAAAP